jgi:ABC-2 type transport system ATP-binding protein
MIEVKNLTKHYGRVKAVTDVSFSVGANQVLGFLGPNGAGKTTIMKILTGFHFPTSGTALIDGIPVNEDPVEVKKRVGYLPENVPLYGDMTVDEYLAFAAEARLIPKRERSAAITACLEACSLSHCRGRKIETLSKGYRQRAGLAQAILHDPPILILDEPTAGLDPNQIIEIRALIKELGKTKTVILCTHILQEVGAVCSQVLIINEGRIAAQGSPDEISGGMKGGENWELALKGADAPAIEQKIALLDGASNVTARGEEDGTVSAAFFIPSQDGTASGERIFDWAVAQNLKILGMNRKKLSIEDIFVKLTSDEKTVGRTGDES